MIKFDMKIITIFCILLSPFILTGCVSTPQSRADENPDLFGSFTTAQKETILKGEVDLEFTPEMVMMAAGLPDKKAKKRSELRETEVWTYYKYSPRAIYAYEGRYDYWDHFSYNSYYGCYLRRPYFGRSVSYASGGDREKNLVVDFQSGRVVAYEMVQ